jgi:hypothetical protein
VRLFIRRKTFSYLHSLKSRHSLVGIATRATGWTIEVLGFDSLRGLGIFLFTTTSRTALGPTQLPIQCVPEALSLEVKRPECEADRSPPSSAEVKECVELYLHTPNTPSWRGAQFKKKAQGQLYHYLLSLFHRPPSLFLYFLIYFFAHLLLACDFRVEHYNTCTTLKPLAVMHELPATVWIVSYGA